MTDETMRAVRFERYGGVEELQVTEVPRPRAAPGRVLVQVRAAALNPGEASIRRGLMHDRWPARFPSGEGSDFAGVVTEVGDGVTSVTPGAEVIGWTDERASHAEAVSVPARQLVPKLAGVSWEAAGSCTWPAPPRGRRCGRSTPGPVTRWRSLLPPAASDPSPSSWPGARGLP